MTKYPDQIQSDYLELIAKNLAHELKTSLVAVKSGIRGVKDYVPLLVEAYQEAIKHHLKVPDIQTRHLNMLMNALELAERAAHCVSTYVNIFALNMSKVEITQFASQKCSMLECVHEMVNQYPYRSDEQKDLLSEAIQIEKDFLFLGNKGLVVNLLINILKNAIYRIQEAGEGGVKIWSELSEQNNYLFIRDTAKGMSAVEQEMIFMPFQQLHQYDLGMGLFFCKQLMNALKGDIICSSGDDRSVEFKIIFPVIKAN